MGQGTAGKNSRIYLGGTSTAMVDEACTENSGTEFQVTDSVKRVLDPDPSVGVVVKVDGSVVSDSTYTINYHFGTITFTMSQTGSTVTVTANYIPRHLILRARSTTPDFTTGEEDTTCFGDDGTSRILTLQDLEVTAQTLDAGQSVLDGDELTITKALFDGTPKLWEYKPGDATGEVYRAWVLFTQQSHQSPADGLVTHDVTARLDQRFNAAPYAVGTP